MIKMLVKMSHPSRHQEPHVFGNFSFYGDHDHFDDRCTTHHAILRRNMTTMSVIMILVILMIVMHDDDQDLEME